jgi:hypothetical protein
MTYDEMSVADFEREYKELVRHASFGAAELYRLGRHAGKIATERRGPHRTIAYILRAVLFDLAQRADARARRQVKAIYFFER